MHLLQVYYLFFMEHSALMQPLFVSPQVRIELVPAIQTVHLMWQGYVSGNEYRTALLKGLEAVQTHGLTGWLADLSGMEVINEEDENWANAVFFPQLVGSTVQKMAIVVSTDIFNQLSVEQIMNRVEGANFTVQYFEGVTAAMEWFLE
jgi:hypothetical protein